MKSPKKPKAFRYPRIYWQPAWNRIRILYPDGEAEWLSGCESWHRACYCYDSTSRNQTLKGMKDYDSYFHNQKAVFIGEIR